MRRNVVVVLGVLLSLASGGAAVADVVPLGGYGSGGTTSVTADCPHGLVVAVEPMADGGEGVLEFCSRRRVQVTRVLPDGGPDSAFGDAGTARITPPRGWSGQPDTDPEMYVRLQPAPDGGLFVLFDWYTESKRAKNLHVAAARLGPEGARNSSFGTNGFARLVERHTFGEYCMNSASLVDRAGRLLVLTEGEYADRVSRFTVAGRLDTSYGRNGHATVGGRGRTSPGFIDGDCVWAGIRGNNVYVVMYGQYNSRPNWVSDLRAVMRLTSHGHIDRSYGRNGAALLKLGRFYRGFDANDVLVPVLDSRGRVTMLIGRNNRSGAERWLDWERLTRHGHRDGRFADRTKKIWPRGHQLLAGDVGRWRGHVVATYWRGKPLGLLGLNGNGSRWEAVETDPVPDGLSVDDNGHGLFDAEWVYPDFYEDPETVRITPYQLDTD
ncbi:MAG TPA: hypothetical protein VFJ19_07705 [Nocardioidaceae bacterium]|nr:hypothetical protein [Nocardioidaceae bacterium]